jgi:hypothetical protein
LHTGVAWEDLPKVDFPHCKSAHRWHLIFSINGVFEQAFEKIQTFTCEHVALKKTWEPLMAQISERKKVEKKLKNQAKTRVLRSKS